MAAGGIATGRQMLAAMVLGAEGVQVGSRFVASNEASCHMGFKNTVVNAGEGDTMLTLKNITPVRMIKNKFFYEVNEAEQKGATREELENLLGKRRAKSGMFEGQLDKGELEIGQVSAIITSIKPAAEIVSEIYGEYEALKFSFLS